MTQTCSHQIVTLVLPVRLCVDKPSTMHLATRTSVSLSAIEAYHTLAQEVSILLRQIRKVD